MASPSPRLHPVVVPRLDFPTSYPTGGGEGPIFQDAAGTPLQVYIDSSTQNRFWLIHDITENGGAISGSTMDADLIIGTRTGLGAAFYEFCHPAWLPAEMKGSLIKRIRRDMRKGKAAPVHWDTKVLLDPRWVAACIAHGAFLGDDVAWAGYRLGPPPNDNQLFNVWALPTGMPYVETPSDLKCHDCGAAFLDRWRLEYHLADSIPCWTPTSLRAACKPPRHGLALYRLLPGHPPPILDIPAAGNSQACPHGVSEEAVVVAPTETGAAAEEPMAVDLECAPVALEISAGDTVMAEPTPDAPIEATDAPAEMKTADEVLAEPVINPPAETLMPDDLTAEPASPPTAPVEATEDTVESSDVTMEPSGAAAEPNAADDPSTEQGATQGNDASGKTLCEDEASVERELLDLGPVDGHGPFSPETQTALAAAGGASPAAAEGEESRAVEGAVEGAEGAGSAEGDTGDGPPVVADEPSVAEGPSMAAGAENSDATAPHVDAEGREESAVHSAVAEREQATAVPTPPPDAPASDGAPRVAATAPTAATPPATTIPVVAATPPVTVTPPVADTPSAAAPDEQATPMSRETPDPSPSTQFTSTNTFMEGTKLWLDPAIPEQLRNHFRAEIPKAVGAFVDKWQHATHVIGAMDTEAEIKHRRDMGIWTLRVDWVNACLRLRRRVPEALYTHRHGNPEVDHLDSEPEQGYESEEPAVRTVLSAKQGKKAVEAAQATQQPAMTVTQSTSKQGTPASQSTQKQATPATAATPDTGTTQPKTTTKDGVRPLSAFETWALAIFIYDSRGSGTIDWPAFSRVNPHRSAKEWKRLAYEAHQRGVKDFVEKLALKNWWPKHDLWPAREAVTGGALVLTKHGGLSLPPTCRNVGAPPGAKPASVNSVNSPTSDFVPPGAPPAPVHVSPPNPSLKAISPDEKAEMIEYMVDFVCNHYPLRPCKPAHWAEFAQTHPSRGAEEWASVVSKAIHNDVTKKLRAIGIEVGPTMDSALASTWTPASASSSTSKRPAVGTARNPMSTNRAARASDATSNSPGVAASRSTSKSPAVEPPITVKRSMSTPTRTPAPGQTASTPSSSSRPHKSAKRAHGEDAPTAAAATAGDDGADSDETQDEDCSNRSGSAPSDGSRKRRRSEKQAARTAAYSKKRARGRPQAGSGAPSASSTRTASSGPRTASGPAAHTRARGLGTVNDPVVLDDDD